MAVNLQAVGDATQRGTGVVGTSGAETVVWAIALQGGSANATLEMKDGDDSGDGTTFGLAALANDTTTMNFSNGLHFASGLYVVVSGTGATVSLSYSQ